VAGRVRLVQNSFTSGELSPRMAGRTDVEYYFNGAETVENWIVFPQGGLKTRPGMRFIAEVKETDLDKKIRLLPFQFNDEQAYVFETGENYFRFYRDTSQILANSTATAVTNGTFDSNITGWTNRSAGTGASAWEASGVLQLTGNGVGNEGRAYQSLAIAAPDQSKIQVIRFQIKRGTVNFRIGTAAGGAQIHTTTAHSTGYHTIAFNPGANAAVFVEFENTNAAILGHVDNVAILSNVPVELGSNYLDTELFDLQFDQSADVMWFAHGAHKPQELSRLADSSWTIDEYLPTNDPFVTPKTHPRAVALWRSRLWWGGTDDGPNEFWATQVDDFSNLDPGTELDNEAINGVIAGGRINVIRSMVGLDKQLFVGTYGSEMFIKGDTAGVVAPATVNNNPATEHGISTLRPTKASGYLLFLQRSRRKIRQLTYDFNTDAFVAPDLLLLSDHLAEDQIVDLAYAEDPEPIIWAVNMNGELLGATFLPTHKVLGWHRHTTAGTVEAVAVIPHPDGDRDQVWMITRRTIAGVERRFVEAFEDGAGYYGQYTLDCALHYEDKRSVELTLSAVSGAVTVTADIAVFTASDVGKQLWHGKGINKGALLIEGFTSTTVVTGTTVVDFESTLIDVDEDEDGPWRIAVKTLTGLNHLIGQKAAILVDGAPHTAQTVSAGGTVTLEAFSAQAEVGLQYVPRLVTLRPEVQGAATIQGLTSTRSDVKLRVIDTVLLTVNGQILPDRAPDDLMDAVPAATTGDLTVPTTLDWEDDGKLTITQDVPLPATIVALMGYVHFGDE